MADIYNLSDLWNNSGTIYTSIRMNVNDSASDANSMYIDLLSSNTSFFQVRKDGHVKFSNGFSSTSNSGYLSFGSSSDLTLYRDAADTLSVRRTTNAQAVKLYNTWTDASNYERASFAWSTNVLQLMTEEAGTGTARGLELRASNGTIIANSHLQANGINTPDQGELTIATGAITVTGSFHTVDTEADAASDDLDTINGGKDGMLIILQAENDSRSVVVKDGTGNIQCSGDMTLDNSQDTITLMYASALSAWCEIARSNNGA